MSSDMQIVVSQEEGRVPIAVFHVKGEIGAHNYDQIQGQVSETFGNGTRNLILDLSEVTYMSSAGLRALHSIFKIMHPDTADQEMETGVSGGTTKSPHLKVVTPPPDILKVIKAVGFDVFLEIYDSREKAVASF